MGISVKFYSLSKKLNSTKQPSGAALAELTCVLKDGTGIISPVIEVNISSNPATWNYCYISDFSRYYFVSEWTYFRGVWTASLSVDVLASFKTQIGGSTQYVTRSEKKYDPLLCDTRYATKTNQRVIEGTFGSSTIYSDFTSGNYVVSVINSDAVDSAGGLIYYVLSYTQMKSLRQLLLSDIDYMGIADPDSAVLAKTEVNPFQYITSIKYFPCSVAKKYQNGQLVSRTFKLGWWTPTNNYHPAGMSLNIIADLPQTVGSNSQTITTHPQQARGTYLNYSPYTSVSLLYGCFGEIPLPMEIVADHRTISTAIYPDYATGKAALYLVASNDLESMRIGTYIADFAVDIPVTAITMQVNAQNGQAAAAAAQMAFAGPITDFISSVGLADAMSDRGSWMAGVSTREEKNFATGWVGKRTASNAVGLKYGQNTVTSNISGSMGSLSVWSSTNNLPHLKIVFTLLADENLTSFGRPLCQSTQISTAGGFVMCGAVNLDLPATETEHAVVSSYMTGGFYYE